MAFIGNTVQTVPFITDTFSGTGAQTAFTPLTRAPAGTASIAVFIAGVYQAPSAYTLSGVTLTFVSAPTAGSGNIIVLHLGNGSAVQVPSSGSVTISTLSSDVYGYINAAFATANTVAFAGSYANSGFTTANSAGVYANSAFLRANTPSATANSAASYANGAFAKANTGGLALTDDTTTNDTRFPLLSTATSGTLATGNTSSSKLTYNPSTGTLTSTIVTSSSDFVLKKDIITFENALDVIKSLRGVSFRWKDNGNKNIGLVAQEVEQILPEVVKEDSGLKSVNYSSIVGVLVEAIKEQQTEIEILKKKIG